MAEASAGIGNVAHNKPLIEMAMGYSRSRILCAAARLGVADALGDQERSVEQLAVACNAHAGSLYRLLRALASLGIVVERSPRRFVLTAMGEPLRQDVPNSQWAGVVFWADLLADSWSRLTECVRTGENAHKVMAHEGVASRWSQDPNADSIFRAVMGTSPAEAYMPIARAWDFSKYSTVADLGGGGGALIAAVLEAYPNIHGMLVDRQESVERARSRFESARLAGRCRLIAADLCASVPSGADVYMLKHVLHGYTDEQAVAILGHCREVLPREGRVLVIEFVLPDVVDHVDAELERRLMSDLNMLAVTGGKERSAVEWRQLLEKAGLACRGIIPVAGEMVSIIEGAPRS